jgi:hypothetical protein
LWFAPTGKGEPFDIDFKAQSLFAVFRRVLVRGEMALDEQHCTFGNRPLNGFSLVAPDLTGEPDGDVLHAALRVDGKREFSKWYATFCYYELRIAFYLAECLHLNKHRIAPLGVYGCALAFYRTNDAK